MPAFDSRTNVNASGTLSWAAIALQDSTSDQTAAGFFRNSGKRYFEFAVNSTGNDPTKLWLGVGWSGYRSIGRVWGGAGQSGQVFSTGIAPSTKISVGSITVSASDVYGVAINFDEAVGADGTSISVGGPGGGIVCVHRNGTYFASLVFPKSADFMAGIRPLVLREGGTSLSTAQVSLRVSSLSYSYMPTGYSEWQPSGGLTVTGSGTVTFAWIPQEKGDGWSISGTGSAKYSAYVPTTITGGGTLPFVRTPALPQGAKVFFEVLGEATISYQAAGHVFSLWNESKFTTLTAVGITNTVTNIGRYGLGDFQNKNTLTIDGSQTNSSSWGGPAMAGQGGSTPNNIKYLGVAYDPARGVILTGLGGVGTAAFDINASEPTFSITASVTLFLTCHYGRFAEQAMAGQYAYLNDGAKQGFWFPMPPGWKSINRQRLVTGGDCYWVKHSSEVNSHTLTIVNEIQIAIGANSNGQAARANKGHYSGKKYFEVLLNVNSVAVGTSILAGVTNKSDLSISYGSVGDWTAGLYGHVLENGPTYDLMQNGVTISAGQALSLTFGLYYRACVAIDFANGKGWIGFGDPLDVKWHNAGDPAAGTGHAFSFTASTTLYPVIGVYPTLSPGQIMGFAAFEEGGMRYPLPSGFEPWASTIGGISTLTATITPSSTSGGNVLWPFGVRP